MDECLRMQFHDAAVTGDIPAGVLGAVIAATGQGAPREVKVHARPDRSNGGLVVVTTTDQTLYRGFPMLRTAMAVFDAIQEGVITPTPAE
jgi:hypothetical protein